MITYKHQYPRISHRFLAFTAAIALGLATATASAQSDLTALGNGSFNSLTISNLDCTTNSNGGALTTDASGNVSCSNDDSGGGGGGTGSIIYAGEPFMGANVTTYGLAGFSGSENRARFAAPRNGTLTNLFAVASGTMNGGSSVTITVRINASNTALQPTIDDSDGESSVGNTASSVAVSQGDLISVQFQETSGNASGQNIRASFEYQ